ncbi:P44/Msp2 family outer membrane protein [Ehrlichia ruminantium]|uniref:P44/Msp2 family outer membrane protein n=1 Tax=Ehrlichia ruminantium TaxID=779 RepID=A0AAE6UIV5_EHRRU|nr:P44/Msp2 family outer membrane protein [Ehrlichia ruminantium]QGR02926.1 P44/Msp2 family outer membrane protein [Ehrlichia ruminantium]QGR03850.1 P44/Msp2 family outer membrane protein [Ehrlichia ruminantium]QGR04777.1 P44/Msp2 family outer membrane protein [Ehrlichia ruminantium]
MKKLHYLNFILVLLITYLLPQIAFSEANIVKPYVTINYQPSISNFRNFNIKETDFDTKGTLGVHINTRNISVHELQKTPHNFISSHNKHYQHYDNDLSAFTTSIGASLKNLRIELEGAYKTFDVSDLVQHVIKDAHRLFAIPRELIFHDMLAFNDPSIPKYSTGHTILKNNGLTIISNMINLCYEKKRNNLTPYICFGIGGDFIEIFDTMKIKAAYQGKIGISYSITPNTTLLISGQYHKVIGNQFKDLPTIQIFELKRLPNRQPEYDVTALLTLDIEYFSSEVGLSFTF